MGLAVAVGTTALVGGGCDAAEPEVGAVALDQDDGQSAGGEPGDGGGDGMTAAAAATPLELGPVVSDAGITHVFADDDVELGSGQVLEVDPVTRPLVADALLADGRARCRATLIAPPDRALVARGELTVAFVLEDRDGEVQRIPSHRVVVDVTLAAGERRELETGRARPVAADEVRGVSCEAVHQPHQPD